jgi:hypothetical protein
MLATVSRSYQIFRQSLAVLQQDKEILIFPVLSGIATLLAFGGLVFGGVITGFFSRLLSAGDRSLEGNLLGYGALFVWYFVSWFIVLFFNVGVVQCARIRLEGGDPTAADGFAAARANLGRIVVWALISATVGIILRVVAERMKLVGRIITYFVGAAWSIATYFIVPVMIFEKRDVRQSLRESIALIRKTWGEALVAHGGVGLFVTLLAMAALPIPFVLLYVSPVAAAIGLGIMVFYWLGLAVLSSALTGIFRTGLYLYAREGNVPPGISPEYVQNAFASKPAKGILRTA